MKLMRQALTTRALVAIICLTAATALHAGPWQGNADGYPLSNFAVTANVGADGSLFGDILHNRGKLGPWLTDLGALSLGVRKYGREYAMGEFADRRVRRACPFVQAELKGHESICCDISYTAWAPAGLDDLDATSLPVLQLEMSFSNHGERRESLELVMRADSLLGPGAQKALKGKAVLYGNYLIYCDKGIKWSNNGQCATVRLGNIAPGATKAVRIAVILYDPLGRAAIRFDSPLALSSYVTENWEALKGSTQAFDAAIPSSGDPEVDEYLRWYMVPALALTRTTAKGKVLTLGYCELNQRDSYWASWMHLALMPSAERIMIEESVAGMRSSGKIPTCLMPKIDRKYDIDINAFFLLRCYRYITHYQDLEMLHQYWEPIKRAAAWLMELDTEGIGLPRQKSTWADWKDVAGVRGRSYSPFACMVYLAAMNRMALLAEMEGDDTARELYAAAFDKGCRQLNRPVSEGGLWNGEYYCQRWDDGREDDHILQDQTIGIFYGVVPRDRAISVISSLNRHNMTPYGICETYPYWPAEFGYEPATYHNGGVWPWLSFMDGWGRIKLGRREEAIDHIKKVARADLVASGDWSANEHLNSLTGENLGFRLQGWDAALFGLVYYGLSPDLK